MKWNDLNLYIKSKYSTCYGRYISNFLRKGDILQIIIHGEGEKITPKEEAETMDPCLKYLHLCIKYNVIDKLCV